jgi:branched-chain amino acid transport system ATP-binding protein
MPMLKLTDLHVSYGPIRAVQGASFEVNPGETVALVGSNGAGKSSILKAIVGLVRPSQGTIELDGKPIGGRPPEEIVKLKIGYSPEGRRVFPQLTVKENLLAGGYTMGAAAVKERMEQVFRYFPRLQERISQFAGSMSGGEQQMVAIARALMSRPKVLLLDEPSMGLAPVVVERIGDLVSEVQRQEELSVILAEQNANWALRLAQRAVVLQLGRVVRVTGAEALLEDPVVQHAYLGA